MGVFKIARAEFIKIFKKPSVYIMGVVLATVLVLSLFFFEPIGKQDYIVNLSGKNVAEIYDKFANDNNTLGGDNKQSKFDATINESLNKLNFYFELNSHNENLQRLNTEFPSLFDDLSKLVKDEKANQIDIDKVYKDVKDKIDEYFNIYSNVDVLKNECAFYKLYADTPLYQNAFDLIKTIKNSSANDSASTFVNIVVNNGYLFQLNKIYEVNINYIAETLKYVTTDVETNYKTFYKSATVPNPSYPDQVLDENKKLTTSVKKVQSYVKTLADSKYNISFIEKAEYDKINNVFTYVITELESYLTPDPTDTTSNKERHEKIANNLEKSKFIDSIKHFNSSIRDFNISTKTITNLKKTIDTRVTDLKKGIMESITTLNTSSGAKTDTVNKNKMNNLITNYRVLALNTTALVNSTIDLEATEVFDSSDISKFINYVDFNEYETKENLTRTNYFIKNGVYNQNYNDVFAFNKNSGIETNAYDFMFFAMKIATVIISAFAILMAASLIASEFDSGTIKLLAMRPFKRWKIITGKLLATMFFVLVFILFSLVISFVAGVCMYPLSATPILAVLGGTVAFAIHPILLMLIEVGFIILEVFFYAVLALSISTIFRTFTGAISVSFVAFLLAISLNVLLGGAIWYSFIPFMNVDFFRFFGGSFLQIPTGGINQIFASTLLTNSNIFVSIGIYSGTILLLLTIAYVVFRRRDL